MAVQSLKAKKEDTWKVGEGRKKGKYSNQHMAEWGWAH